MFHRTTKAQAMAEFALALPILLLVVYGLIEAGRLIFIYSAVITASREAVRFGSAWGIDDARNLHYQDCAGIRNAAKSVTFLLTLQDANIVISHDQGLNASGQPVNMQQYCSPGTNVDTSVALKPGNRVTVQVSYNYSPILNFLPLTSQPVSSGASRTIMGDVVLSATATPSSP